MKSFNEIVADNLVYLRRSKKMTQIELAEQLNYSDKSISKWEHGETLPDIEVLNRLANLYGVSLDYIVTNTNHEDKFENHKKTQNKQNQIIISLLCLSFVWFLAAVIFVYTNLILQANYWLVFVWALPVSCAVLIYFNKLWGPRKFLFFLMSFMLWSLLLCFYLQFLKYNIWLLFLIAMPVQGAIILWSQLKI